MSYTELDRQLLSLARTRQPPTEAVEALMAVVRAAVSQSIRRRASGRIRDEEAEELVHDVVLILLCSEARVLRSWDPEKGSSLKSFIALIADRFIISTLRARRCDAMLMRSESEEHERPASRYNVEEQLLARDQLLHLMGVMKTKLPEHGWALFRWLLIEEVGAAKVEADTGLSRAAVHAWRSRLRKVARKHLSELNAETPIPEVGHSGDHGC